MARKPSNRGKKAGPRAPIKHDYQAARHLLSIFGGDLDKMVQWFKKEIVPSPSPEDFDSRVLPGLTVYEEQLWKHQRSPEAKRRFKRRTLELRQQEKDSPQRIKGRVKMPLTREKYIREHIVEPAWEHRKVLGLGGGTIESAVRRLVRKLRKAGTKLGTKSVDGLG